MPPSSRRKSSRCSSRSSRSWSGRAATCATRRCWTSGSTSTCRSLSCCSPRSWPTSSRCSSTGRRVKLLVITRDPQRGGQVKKTVVADWVRVGRNASSEIFLPDPRIALEQGMIVYRDGLVYLEGESGVASKNTTRKSVRSVRLKPGQPVDIGPYRLETLPAPPGFDGAISVELVRPLEIAPGLANRTSRLTLGSLGLPKRWAASRAVAELGIGDRFWNPGPVTLAHQPIEKKCAACHEVAFQHVKNGACLECH